MSIHKGYNSVFCFNQGTDWDAEVACAAADRFLATGESMSKNVDTIKSGSLNGTCVRSPGAAGNIMCEGSVDCEAAYGSTTSTMHDILWAMALGSETASAQQGTSAAYEHRFDLLTDPEGLHGTLCITKTSELWEFAGTKVTGFEFSAAQNQIATVSFPMIAFDCDLASSTNVKATVEAFAIPVAVPITWAHLADPGGTDAGVFVNAQAGADYDVGDKIYPSEFSVSLNRGMEGVRTCRYAQQAEEPHSSGWVEVTGSMTFPDYGDAHSSILTKLASKAEQKMKLAFQGGTCDGAYAYNFIIWLNNVQFDEGTPNVSGPGLQSLTFSFSANTASAAPTGFPTGLSEAVGITYVNLKDTDILD